MIKKLIGLMVAMLMLFSLAACNKSDETNMGALKVYRKLITRIC